MEIIRPESNQPLPPQAKKVFQGVIFDVYQWEQKLFDGSTAIFEKLKRPDSCVIIAVTAEGKIIITHEEQPGRKPFQSLPGGRIEAGEDIVFAAQRELLEETGYCSEDWELLNAAQFTSKIDWAVFTLVARNCQKVAEPNPEAGEKIGIEEVSFDSLVSLITEEFWDKNLKIKFLKAQLDPNNLADLKKIILK